MKLIHKITSAVLALSFLVACNFCVVGCAFASESHESAGQCHGDADHDKSQDQPHHSDSQKHDAGSTCCSSLIGIAAKGSSAESFSTELLKNFDLVAVTSENADFKPDTHSKNKPEFPPGTSPPFVFLLTHFSHAPPTSL